MIATYPENRNRRLVKLAAAAQLLVALAFLGIPIVGLLFGGEVQSAVEAEVARQGQPPNVLADNGLSFAESGKAIVLPVAIALIVAALIPLTLAGKRIGRILSWIVMPVVVLINVAIMLSQAGAVRALEDMFASSSDARLRSLDAQALLDAATGAYPGWVSILVNARNVVVFAGALVILVTLVRSRSSRSVSIAHPAHA